jgi:hypothetical protein
MHQKNYETNPRNAVPETGRCCFESNFPDGGVRVGTAMRQRLRKNASSLRSLWSRHGKRLTSYSAHSEPRPQGAESMTFPEPACGQVASYLIAIPHPQKAPTSTRVLDRKKNHPHDSCRNQPPQPQISNSETKQRGKTPWLRFATSVPNASDQRYPTRRRLAAYTTTGGALRRFLRRRIHPGPGLRRIRCARSGS